MIKKLIVLCMVLGSCAMLRAADTVMDRVTLSRSSAMPYLAAVKRVVVPTCGMPFNLFVQGCCGPQLLSIADKHADSALKQFFAYKQHLGFSKIAQELEAALQPTFNALCMFLRGDKMLIAYKGPETKALLLFHDGNMKQITSNSSTEVSLLKLPYAATYKGIVFLRGMSLTNERVAGIVNTLHSITINPELIAQDLVNADMGDAVAAAYLDYELLRKIDADAKG